MYFPQAVVLVMGCCGDDLPNDIFRKIYLFWTTHAGVHESQDKEMKQHNVHHHPCKSVAY